MESIVPDISFLVKPKIKCDQLKYIMNTKNVYANLYEIDMKKEIKLYQYPYTVSPPIPEGNIRMREKLFKATNRDLKKIYEECFFSGDSLYSMKKIEENKTVKGSLILKGKTEYTFEFSKFQNEKIIKKEDIQKDPLTKQFIELIIRDILHSNPRLEFYKGFFVIQDQKHKIETERVSVTFYPGFTTSFMETDSGNYLNVTLKNKIIQNETILDYLRNSQYNNVNNRNDIKEELKGKSFKVSYAKRNYIIEDILFDKNPRNQTFNYQGETKNLVEYYEIAYNLKIKDLNQPLILSRRKNPQGEPINLHFVPEFCSLSGLNDESVKDGKFMRELANYTKFEPNDRVNETNQFIKLLLDPSRDPKNPNKLSAKEKCEFYGIEVKPVKNLFTAYYMKDTKLIAGNHKEVHSKDRTFPVYKKKNLENWVCIYEKENYKGAELLYNTLDKASKAFGLKVAEPEWYELKNKAKLKEWTDAADEYFGKGKNREFDFVVFFLGRNDRIYPELKKHSLCKNGYVSQVVKSKTLQKKGGAMSVCSKILLQINAKLGGISYKAVMDKTIDDRKLMVVGVYSSHIRGKRTGVAMVATINDTFTDFYNKEDIIKEENNKEQLQYCVSSFIEEAVASYNKNNKTIPKGIVIYRQGVSLQQKEFLKTEIAQIDNVCKTKGILYYYVLVNTKTTFKFFEKNHGNNYSNPGPGLLVIDGVTNRNFFEFYIQPQEVTQGSATPTCFHVAYGNLDFPEMIAKFTYDLCHIYSNWQGTVRIPNVIKAAAKLSKMTVKYTLAELNPKLKEGQAYL